MSHALTYTQSLAAGTSDFDTRCSRPHFFTRHHFLRLYQPKHTHTHKLTQRYAAALFALDNRMCVPCLVFGHRLHVCVCLGVVTDGGADLGIRRGKWMASATRSWLMLALLSLMGGRGIVKVRAREEKERHGNDDEQGDRIMDLGCRERKCGAKEKRKGGKFTRLQHGSCDRWKSRGSRRKGGRLGRRLNANVCLCMCVFLRTLFASLGVYTDSGLRSTSVCVGREDGKCM